MSGVIDKSSDHLSIGYNILVDFLNLFHCSRRNRIDKDTWLQLLVASQSNSKKNCADKVTYPILELAKFENHRLTRYKYSSISDCLRTYENVTYIMHTNTNMTTYDAKCPSREPSQAKPSLAS